MPGKHLSVPQGILGQSTPLRGIPTVESAARAPHEHGRIIHLEVTHFLQLLQRFYASHKLEDVMAGVVSTDIALEGTLLDQDSRFVVDQSKIEMARPAVDRAFVLEYEDMSTGKSSKLSRSQCLRLGRKEIPEVGRLLDGRVPQIRSMGGSEGQRVISTSGPSIYLL